MNWRLPLAMLGAIVVIAILAGAAEAQTDPPASGVWYISDYTTFSGGKVDVPDDVMIRSGGTLALFDVDLLLNGVMVELRVEEGGTLITEGGLITATGPVRSRININSPSSLNGTVIGNSYGVWVKSWDVSITNCTLSDYGITVQSPSFGNPSMPIDITHNTLTNTNNNAIVVYITDETSYFKLNIVGNTVSFPAGSGVNVTLSNCFAADLRVIDNTVTNSGGVGIYLNAAVTSFGLEFDGNEVRDCDDSCVYIELLVDNLFFDSINGLTAITSDRFNLHIVNWRSTFPGLNLTGVELRDAGIAGLRLMGARGVAIMDSTVIQTNGIPDFLVEDATLDIFNTTESPSRPWVTRDGGQIISWRFLDLSFAYQNGLDVTEGTVELRDPSGGFVARGDVDPDGTWTDIRLWDLRSINPNPPDVRSFITPHLLGSTTDLDGDPIWLDADKSVDVVFLDDVVPILVAFTPEDGVFQNTTSIPVTGRVRDEHSGPAQVQVSIDTNPDWDLKEWLNATGTYNWSLTLEDLPDGVYTVHARAFDRANLPDGTYATLVVGTVTIDTMVDTLEITSPPLPAVGPYLTNATVHQVSGRVGPDVVSVTLNGAAVPITDGTFSEAVDLSEGRNDLAVVATDLAGNTASRSFVVIVDTVTPSIILTAPQEDQYFNDLTVRVAGMVNEPTLDGAVTIDGVTVPVVDDAFEHFLTGQADGRRTIVVSAMDLAGNVATERVSVVLDSTPPILVITEPDPGLLTRRYSLTVRGTTEPGAVVKVNGRQVEVTDGAFSTSVPLEVEGDNLINVQAVDAAGNGASTVVHIVRDTTLPSLEIDGIVNGTITARAKVFHLMGRTEEGATIVYTIDGIEVAGQVLADGTFQHPMDVPSEGVAVTVTVKDPAGNTQFESVLIVRPREEPTPEEPLLDNPVTVGAVVATTAVILGAAATIEVTKYSLILLILPLYARLKGDAVLDNKTRLAIHGLIIENPGMHYNEIIREFSLTNGVAAYHLDVLEREGFVRSVRDGTMRRFYSSTTKVPDGFKATPDEMRDRIIELIDHYPGLPQKAIVDELGIGRTVAGYHLKALVDDGYLSTKRRGRFTLYFRTKKRWYGNGDNGGRFTNS